MSSLTSTSSLITKAEKKDEVHTQSAEKSNQEGVYAAASEGTTESEDLLLNAKERIPSGNRIITAEKMTSPLKMSPAKSVTDKAMQTVIEWGFANFIIMPCCKAW